MDKEQQCFRKCHKHTLDAQIVKNVEFRVDIDIPGPVKQTKGKIQFDKESRYTECAFEQCACFVPEKKPNHRCVRASASPPTTAGADRTYP